MTHPASHTPDPGAGTPTITWTSESVDRAFSGILDQLADVDAIAARALTTEQILTDARDLREAIGQTRILRDIMGSTDAAWFDTRLRAHQRAVDNLADVIRHAATDADIRVTDAEARADEAAKDAKGTRHEMAIRAYVDHRSVVGWRIVSVLALVAGVLAGVAL